MFELFFEETRIPTTAIEYVDSWGQIPEFRAVVTDTETTPWLSDWYPTPYQVFELRAGDLRISGELESVRSDLLGGVEFSFLSFPLDSSTLRTRRYQAYENIPIRELIRTVATRAGISLSFVGEILNLEIDRETQDNESDLAFLVRICERAYLYPRFSPDGLTILSILELDRRPPVATLTRSDLLRSPAPDFSDTVLDAFGRVEVSTDTFTVAATGGRGFRTELIDEPGLANQSDALAYANAVLSESDKKTRPLSLGVRSNYSLLLGDNMELEFPGVIAGKYQIRELNHSQSSSSKSTQLSLVKIPQK